MTDAGQTGTKLQVLICTYGTRLADIDLDGLPRVPRVQYLISWQNPGGIALPEATAAIEARTDIELHTFADIGGSLNRNHTLDMATAPYVAISDDDLSYNAATLTAIIDAFDSEPRLDMITTRTLIEGETHIYPPDGFDISRRYRFYSPIAIELAYRRSSLEAAGLRFSLLTGIGAPYLPCAEENFFFLHSVRAGLKGMFLDMVLSKHKGVTTCTHSAAKAGIIRAKGAFLMADRGAIGAIARLPLEAYRSKASFINALTWLTEGAVYYLKHRKEL